MEWYNFLACFFAGAFLTNAIPHFIHGVSGDKFPTPFAKPPGEGLSSATINMLWALLNLIIGYLLFTKGNISTSKPWSVIVFFAGIACMGIMSSITFQKKHKI